MIWWYGFLALVFLVGCGCGIAAWQSTSEGGMAWAILAFYIGGGAIAAAAVTGIIHGLVAWLT